MLRRAALTRLPRPSPARFYSKEHPDPQLQGYPELPNINRQWLPPRGWDDVQNRRNFGDTLHEEGELYSMWGPDIPTTEPKTALKDFLTAFGALGAFVYFLYLNPPEQRVVPRTYPHDGLVQELGGLDANKARPATE